MKSYSPLKFLHFFLVSLITTAAHSQIGIDTTDPKTTLDINGAVSLRDGGALTLINGNNNDISLGTTPYSVYRIAGPTSDFTVSGITPLSGADGQIVTLVNTTDQALTILHNRESSSANRILCPGGQNLTVTGQFSTVSMIYNASESKWFITDQVSKGYGDNITSVKGSSDILNNSDSFTDMADMIITFTPNHSTVYVNFSASGGMDLSTILPVGAFGFFRIVNVSAGDRVEAATATLTTDYDLSIFIGEIVASAWNASITMFPVSVTPGQVTTLKIQWLRNGLFPTGMTNYVSTLPESSHRVLTIVD